MVRSRLAGIILVASLVPPICPPLCLAQQPPALSDILLHLQDNLWDYQANVPNFFADEHVVSVLRQEGARDIKTATDSIFRLVRSKEIGEANIFTESREIKLVNKKPAKGGDIQGPAIFSGGFSTAASFVSLEMSRCFDYTLEPPAILNKAPAILISYTLKLEAITDESCPGIEKKSGRVWIDPADFRVLRMEMVIPSHWDSGSHIRSLWTWAVDFAPVVFDARQFWMPRTITSKSEANDASAIWSFTADYSNYHKLTVKSRIITDAGDTPAPRVSSHIVSPQ